MAARSGADVVLQASGLPVRELRRAAGGRGAALVVDCVGSDDTLALAAGAVAPGGHVVAARAGRRDVPDALRRRCRSRPR